MLKHALLSLVLATVFPAGAALAQASCCAANGGPSGACSPAGLVMCMDGTASSCACGNGTTPPPTLGQLAMPATVAFGPINLGTTSAARAARITNVGALPVTVTDVVSDTPDEIVVLRHDCAVLTGGGACTLDVAFRSATEGARKARIRVTSNGVGSVQSFEVTGTGFRPTASTPPPGPDAPTIAVVEYAHAQWDHYFVTGIPAESAKLDDGAFEGWKRTGLAFKAYPNGLPGTVSMCRFFSTAFAPRSSHFYTPDVAECDKVRANPDWSYEGDVFGVVLPTSDGACPAGMLPLYRLYNDGKDGAPNHRYTLDTGVRAVMVAFGWTMEGAGPLGVIACTPR